VVTSETIITLVVGVRFSGVFVCLSVCLFFCTIPQKNGAARITKLNTEMFDTSAENLFCNWKVKGQGHESQKHCLKQ